MLRLSRPLPRRQRESTIALINVVFLMLVFFLVAGSLAPPIDKEIELISTAMTEPSAPPDALFVTGEGELRARGETTTVAAFIEDLTAGGTEADEIEVKLAADRNLPAVRLIEIVGELRQAGAARISIVTEIAE
ncbi:MULTISPECIES: ExbD/TolR family protein [Chelativorans]|jgi:biopolymer transport protein ExbD|uniref:Biopolymer transport protein ExbD/TolR n=1 Tax=Chelativorans sp. (strain BNC1) TaxID=266779 RepID=Q11IE3_CHESB|nr:MULTISPECIES: biopolymer transporter ExbD [Chelativorans]